MKPLHDVSTSEQPSALGQLDLDPLSPFRPGDQFSIRMRVEQDKRVLDWLIYIAALAVIFLAGWIGAAVTVGAR